MMEGASPLTTQAPAFGDADFSALAALAKREFGLDLAESKKPLVYSRLSKRLKAKGLTTFKAYLELVDGDNSGDEKQALISALTTNVTSFFRERHHFETLTSDVLEPMRKAVENGARLRIWSAGCSTGQEPYSIAMTVLNAIPSATHKDVRILATDIDPQVVKKAKQGRYDVKEAEALQSEGFAKYFKKTGNHLDFNPDVKSLISFGELNLMENWPVRGPFDAIFCRNVAIYFDHETQKRLWNRFCSLIRTDGMMFIGHSERMSGPAQEHLAAAGITTYRKSSVNARSTQNGNEK